MAGEFIDPDDGAPDCRICGDTGSVNGHPCDHRDSKRLGATAEVVGRFVPKNVNYGSFHFPRWDGAIWVCSCGETGSTSREGADHVEAQRLARVVTR